MQLFSGCVYLCIASGGVKRLLRYRQGNQQAKLVFLCTWMRAEQENPKENDQLMKDYSKLLKANQLLMPRLAFLQIAITKYEFSNAEIAQKVELNQTVLNYYFRNDDIYMSRLNQIANAMEATLNIRITKVIAPEEVTRPRLHTEIVIEKNCR